VAVEKFIEDLGFRIADNMSAAIAIGVIGAIAGLVVAWHAVRRDELNEYRLLGVVLGLGLVAFLGLGMPYVHGRAGDACDRWARSADAADALRFLDHECETHF
jgi:hypothetical protein